MRTFRGRILVIRGGAIGDFILTLPAIAALRKQFPEAHLEVLGYPHIVQLAIAGSLVDRVQSIEARALAPFFASGGELSENMADYFSEFDLIISYLYDPDLIFQTNIARCSSAQFIAGPHRPDESANVPAARVFLRPLERLAIFDADPVPKLSIGPTTEAQERRDLLKRRAIALHPGSGSESKNWPEAGWADLLVDLTSLTPYHLLVIGGEAEGEILQRLAAALPPARVRVAQSLPLAELAWLLQSCCAYVGHDSGISHLAAALGVPTLLLWGESREQVWRPPGPNVVVLRHGQGLHKLPSTIVLEQLRSLLPR